jgi:hypothetical protein
MLTSAITMLLAFTTIDHVQTLAKSLTTPNAFGASQEQRIRDALGRHYEAFATMRRLVPREDSFVLCTAPRDVERASVINSFRTLLYPRLQIYVNDANDINVRVNREQLPPDNVQVFYCDLDPGSPVALAKEWKEVARGQHFRLLQHTGERD